MLHLNISYNSVALGEIWSMFANGTQLRDRRALKVDLVVDPGDVGHLFGHVPRQFIAQMQTCAPAQMRGEILKVPALDRRKEGTNMARHILEYGVEL